MSILIIERRRQAEETAGRVGRRSRLKYNTLERGLLAYVDKESGENNLDYPYSYLPFHSAGGAFCRERIPQRGQQV